MRSNLFVCVISAMLLTSLNSCVKKVNIPVDKKFDCGKIADAKITGAKSLYHVGDTIDLKSSKTASEAYYSWHSSSALNEFSNRENVFIYNCTKYNEGWYYLMVGNSECSPQYDSVYIKVINKVVAPPCNPANNTVSFSSIPDISFSSASWILDPSWNCRVLRGYQSPGYPDLKIYFHPYWNTREPEDGAYDMASTLTFPDNNLYTVFVASLYSGIYFQPHPGKVYVTHVNGKIQATFCNLTLSGSLGGPSYTETASGRLTAP